MRSASSKRPSSTPRPALASAITICPSCKNSPSSATLDLLILLLVLSCCAFLIVSSLAYLSRLLALLVPPASSSHSPLSPFSDSPYPYLAGLLVFLAAAHASCRRPCLPPWSHRRRCGKPRCRSLEKAVEFDVRLQTEECIRSSDIAQSAAWKEIDDLPWKGGQQGNNPDYECLRVDLRKMAPPGGRAVLLFRIQCGCPVAKLEAWAPKRRRHKKASAKMAIEGGEP